MAVPTALTVADFELKDGDIPLFDSFASVALQKLIEVYPPAKTEPGAKPCDWADDIAGLAYYMASSMMATRHEFIKDLNRIVEELNNEG